MPLFQYTARDHRGASVNGTIEADSPGRATELLSAKELFPTRLTETAAPATLQSVVRRSRRVKGSELAIFYGQLAALLRAGVPMIRSLQLLNQQSPNDTLATAVAELRARVEDGQSLGDAMAKHPGVFPNMACNMVRAGGEGGFLEDALVRLASFTELQEDLKGRTASALAYPVFLFTVGILVVTGLLVFFVPSFDSLFDRLRAKGEMPLATEALLSISDLMRRYGLYWLLGITVAGLWVRGKLQTESGRDTMDRMKLKLPVLGGILMNLAVARFCRVLGTLLSGGVPIVRALSIAGAAADNRLLAESVAGASENLQSGDSLAAPLRRSQLFPPAVVEMISVGEESNSLDTVLPDIADNLEKSTFRRLDLFVRLLEPLMLLVMAILVLGVVMALLVPVLKSSQSI